jgi:hypothetical protein
MRAHLLLSLFSICCHLVAQQPAAREATPKAGGCSTQAPASSSFDPASFVRIYEDTRGGKRIPIYGPGCDGNTQLSVDSRSSIVIVPDPGALGEDVPLNKLFIKATLASADESARPNHQRARSEAWPLNPPKTYSP